MKLKKLSERQDRPIGNKSEGSIKTLDNIVLLDWAQQVSSLGPKHPVSDTFNDIF